jgi:hypothetical protein
MASSSTNFASASSEAVPSATTDPSQVPTGLHVSHTSYAAQILFGPRLYPHYIGWQATVLNYGGAQFPGPAPLRNELYMARRSDILGDFPPLLHYKHFMALVANRYPGVLYFEYFEEDQRPATEQNSKRAPFVCGHRPHPACSLKHSLCSRCLVRCNIDTLKRIQAARALLPPNEDGAKPPGASACSQIWSYQKKFWRNIVYSLERGAELEADWELRWEGEGLDIEDAVAGTVRSSEVLKEAISTCPNMADGWEVEFAPNPKRADNRCRYRSILRLDDVPVSSSMCGLNANHHFGRTHERRETHGIPCESSSEESVDQPSPPEPFTLPPRKGSAVRHMVERKRVKWADDVADFVKRDSTFWSRGSSHYQPGRWACPDRDGWAHPGGLEHEAAEDEGSDENLSDEEDEEDEEAMCGKDDDSQDVLPEIATPQPRTSARKRPWVDVEPSAENLESRAKRRKGEESKPAHDSWWNRDRVERTEPELEPKPEQEPEPAPNPEVTGEARINAMIRKNCKCGSCLQRAAPSG